MNRSEAAHYLAAMIDGEGHVSWKDHNRHVGITNTDLDLIHACEECMEILGIEWKLYTRSKHRSGWRTTYDIIISRRGSLEKVLKYVPLRAERKRTKLADILKSYKPVTPAELLIRLYWHEGLSLQEVGKRVGLTATGVRCRMRNMGIQTRPRNGRPAAFADQIEIVADALGDFMYSTAETFSGADQETLRRHAQELRDAVGAEERVSA